MKIEYGIQEVLLKESLIPEKIKIKYLGNFYVSKINKNYKFIRRGSTLIFIPKNKNTNISEEILFKYIGNIKILSCTVNRKPAVVIENNIDKFDKIKSTWDDLNLEWDDYLMDEKINTELKRLKRKAFNKNELQQFI